MEVLFERGAGLDVGKEEHFADVLDEASGRGYQRRLNSRHSLDFRRYVQEPGSTTIPLTFNLRGNDGDDWRIVEKDGVFCAAGHMRAVIRGPGGNIPPREVVALVAKDLESPPIPAFVAQLRDLAFVEHAQQARGIPLADRNFDAVRLSVLLSAADVGLLHYTRTPVYRYGVYGAAIWYAIGILVFFGDSIGRPAGGVLRSACAIGTLLTAD